MNTDSNARTAGSAEAVARIYHTAVVVPDAHSRYESEASAKRSARTSRKTNLALSSSYFNQTTI